MYIKTTALTHTDYFDTVSMNKSNYIKSIKKLVRIQTNRSDTFLQFSKKVTVSANSGIALIILAGQADDPQTYQEYVLQGSIDIHPGICFNVLSITDECSIYLEPSPNDEPKMVIALQQLAVKQFTEQIKIDQVYSFFYSVKTPPYAYPVDVHDYFEMTIVDQGQLIHEIDGKTYVSGKHDCILYFPNQQHSQRVEQDGVTTYLTILFDASGIDPKIQDQLFHLGNRHTQSIEKMIELSNQHHVAYYADEIILLFKSILIDMLRGEAHTTELPTTSMRENYENELFQTIVEYLYEHVEDENQVNDLVTHFSLSRSTIQMLFNKYANTTPKNYINRLRLNRSKLLIKESKMSLSEIAHELGYGSIQYFSRVFSKEFGMSPSSYAKSILK